MIIQGKKLLEFMFAGGILPFLILETVSQTGNRDQANAKGEENSLGSFHTFTHQISTQTGPITLHNVEHAHVIFI